jgi:hypothetical protein
MLENKCLGKIIEASLQYGADSGSMTWREFRMWINVHI